MTAVKRIMRELRELREPTDQFAAAPLDDNLFEWHFTIAGPQDTAFEGGRYHGRIILPNDYPMKPPNIVLLTPNGRFEVGQKICLTISSHHPESWQPSWSIRTMLMAIITFLPTEGKGAIAALDYTDDERRVLAKKSMNWTCSRCGLCMRDALANTAATLSDADKAAVEEMQKIGFQLAPRSRTSSEASKDEGNPSTAAQPEATQTTASEAVVADEMEGEDQNTSSVEVQVPKKKVVRPAVQPVNEDWSLPMAIIGVLLAIFVVLYRKYSRE